MSTSAATQGRPSRVDRFLNVIERVGNKLPEPFVLFGLLFLLVGFLSTGLALFDVEVTVPGADEPTVIRGLFTGEGLAWISTTLGANFIGFPPLLTVVTILLAVGIAEKTGLLSALIRIVFGSAPRWALPYAVGAGGVIGSVMSDSVFVIVPPLAAMVFSAAGRHPMAGLLGGFAAAGAGYSTNVVPTSLDALFAGITTSVSGVLPDPGTPVNAVSNWYFNIVAAFALILLAGFIIDKVIEPRMVRQDVPREYAAVEDDDETDVRAEGSRADIGNSPAGAGDNLQAALTTTERRALLLSVVSGLVVAVLLAVAILLPASPYRNETGGFLPESPLLQSIVFLVFVMFAVPGVVYGMRTGSIKGGGDIPRLMGLAIKDMIPFLVIAFILGQFVALFNWSGIGTWIAVGGATGLEAINFTGYWAILGFIVLAALLNLFIVSGSSLWTLMAAVFVPLFALLGYEPAFSQAAFRIGDSSTQIMTPLNPYMVVLLGFVRRYEPSAGLGTIMSRMFPFVVPFFLMWTAILTLWFFADLPLGPGNGIMLD